MAKKKLKKSKKLTKTTTLKDLGPTLQKI